MVLAPVKKFMLCYA